jgi:hypothetical protein
VLSRRDFLTGLAATGMLGAGAGVLSGCTIPGPIDGRGAQCVARDTLPSFSRVGGIPIHYEIDGAARAFHYDSGFHSQLETWLTDWLDTSGLPVPTRIDSYGAWTDGGSRCDSWHNAGRAFDLARLRGDGRTLVSCRQDLWAEQSVTTQARLRRGYWALAAHLHIHFAYVLTYLYDTLHRNHIHIDNGSSGSDLSRFRSGSRVQVQAVQATARYLWDEPVEISGRWDAATRSASGRVLGTLGRSDDLTDSGNWHAYLRACARRGIAS